MPVLTGGLVRLSSSSCWVGAVAGVDTMCLLASSCTKSARSPRLVASHPQDTTARRSCRGTGPRASERPCGPVPPLGAASCGLGCVYTPTAPCTPLPPVWEVGRARHRVPPPHARSWPSSPPSHRHPRHAHARGLAAAARLGRPDPGSPRSIPPRCLQHMPEAHARRTAAHLHRQLGGRVGRN